MLRVRILSRGRKTVPKTPLVYFYYLFISWAGFFPASIIGRFNLARIIAMRLPLSPYLLFHTFGPTCLVTILFSFFAPLLIIYNCNRHAMPCQKSNKNFCQVNQYVSLTKKSYPQFYPQGYGMNSIELWNQFHGILFVSALWITPGLWIDCG